MRAIKKWKKLFSEVVFDNPWLTVRRDTVELPDGRVVEDYYVWDLNDVAMVVPVTTEGKLVMVRQYKYGAGEIMLEFPAGIVDEGEEPKETAEREFREETGYGFDSLEPLGQLSNSPTKRTGVIYVYVANEVKKVHDQELEQLEQIEVMELSFEEAMEKVVSGGIWASDTVASLLLYEKLMLN